MLSPRELFTASRGKDPEYFLRRDVPLINGEEISKDHPWYEEAKNTHNAILDKYAKKSHDELSGDAWASWQKGTSTYLTGNEYEVAHRVLAMEKDLTERSKPIPTSLYRGATNPPEEEIKGRGFLSATSNKTAAQKFARASRRTHGTGLVAHFKAGQAHGFPLSDIPGTRVVKLGDTKEDEWIITKVGNDAQK